MDDMLGSFAPGKQPGIVHITNDGQLEGILQLALN
jgi:hypothetical protein